VATRDVFSEDELAQLRGFPEPARAELIRYFTLAPADEAFVRKFRGQDSVMGVAVQLCTLPWLGFVPDDVAAAPAAVVARLSEKLGIPVGALRGYGAREQTRTGHLREVAGYLGWRTVDGPRWKDLEEFLFARAMEHDSPKLLFRQACEYLSSSMLVRPGIVKILERVAAARERAGRRPGRGSPRCSPCGGRASWMRCWRSIPCSAARGCRGSGAGLSRRPRRR
jgi:hypothetical protein